MIRARDVSVLYDGVAVVAGVELRARPGEVIGLIGPNGSGKTTLLRALYASLTPQSGSVCVDDTPVGDLPARERARRIAVVVQESAADLPLTVAELVLLGRAPHLSDLQRYSAADERIMAEALEQVGVVQLASRVYATLSGGERQRVLIARALAQRVRYLLLDEPTNHLDIGYQHQILSLVRGLGVTTVAVLHDLNLAARYCDHLVLMDRGVVRACGSPHDVLTDGVLEAVYGVAVRRIDDDGCVQLVFRPRLLA